MADKRISQLIERVDIANNDVLPIVASGATTTNKVTISTIQDWMQENLDVGVTSVGITIGSTGTDINVTGSPITTSGNITINIPTASATNRGLLSAADWSTFNGKQNSITLTTSGTSGAATLVGSTLNIPNYSTGVANAYVPYVGAIGSVSLGYNALSASQINIDGASPTGGSYLGFKHSTSVNTGTDGYTSMYTFGTNTIGFQSTSGGTSKAFAFSMVGITAGVPGGRQYTLPDASGTLALTSDLSGYVTLGTAQTITAQKTFTASGGDDTLIVNHTSGSGIAVDISKAGNGEGLRVIKTSGTGNAVTITGGLLSAEAATLTGALNGTSASFSGIVQGVQGNFYQSASSGNAIQLRNRNANQTWGLVVDTDAVDDKNLGFYTGSVYALKLSASTGAATFSSSVTANELFIANSSTLANYVGAEYRYLGTLYGFSKASANDGELRHSIGPSAGWGGKITFYTDTTEKMRITSGGVLMVNNTGSVFHNANTVLAGKLFIPFQSNADIGGTIYTYNDQTFATYEGGIRFQTFKYNGSTFNMEDSMTLNGQGRLGIGTTSPGARLEVKQGGSEIPMIIDSSSDSFGAYTQYQVNNSGGWEHGMARAADSYSYLFSYGSFGTANAKVAITNTGNVGIGTSSPTTYSLAGRHLEVNDAGGGYAFIHNNTTSVKAFLASSEPGGHAALYTFSNHPLLFGTGNTERMRITSGGVVAIGKTDGTFGNTGHALFQNGQVSHVVSNDAIMFLNRLGSNGEVAYFYRDSSAVGSISVTTTATSYNTSSDYRLKENVKPVENALSVLTQLKPCTFNFIADADEEVMGFIAHEVQEVIPQAVTGEKDGFRIEQVEVSPAELDEEGNIIAEAVIEEKEIPVYQGIDHSKLVPLLVAAIQEQQEQIKSLTEQVEALKSQING